MNNSRFETAIIVDIDTSELVRGQEQETVAQLAPLVREQNITLNLRKVKRIDAAGLAALITLYCDACKTGHSFRIANPSHHVAELLALVRLDSLLVSHTSEEFAGRGLQLQETAA